MGNINSSCCEDSGRADTEVDIGFRSLPVPIEPPPSAEVAASSSVQEVEPNVVKLTAKAIVKPTRQADAEPTSSSSTRAADVRPSREADVRQTREVDVPEQTPENPPKEGGSALGGWNSDNSEDGTASGTDEDGLQTFDLDCPVQVTKARSTVNMRSVPSNQRPTPTNMRMSCNSAMSRENSTSRKEIVGKPFPKRPLMCKLSPDLWRKLEDLFKRMDGGSQNVVTKEDAMDFFKGSFGSLSRDAMFNEVDVDKSGVITADEFMDFWIQVKAAGYKDEVICDEVDELADGGAWVDWEDGRDTDTKKQTPFPQRPWLCRLSQRTWSKCEELFKKIDVNDNQILTPEVVRVFYTGTFSSVSAEAMFNEIDMLNHGTITSKEFMKFWVQVRASGYKDPDIHDELEILLEGGAWRDWNDGRTT